MLSTTCPLFFMLKAILSLLSSQTQLFQVLMTGVTGACLLLYVTILPVVLWLVLDICLLKTCLYMQEKKHDWYQHTLQVYPLFSLVFGRNPLQGYSYSWHNRQSLSTLFLHSETPSQTIYHIKIAKVTSLSLPSTII